MVWAKLDDEILDNPKVAEAGPLGFALHIAAITWCCRNLSDGFIPRTRVRGLLDFGGVMWDEDNPGAVAGESVSNGGRHGADPLTIADHLVVVGLWDPDPDGRGYWLHDFLEYNPSREKVLAERERARRKKSDSAPPPKASPKPRSSLAGTSAESSPRLRGSSDGPVPAPVPVPSPPNGGDLARPPGGKFEIPTDEPLTDRREGRAEALSAPKGVRLDVPTEWRKFISTSRANGKLVASVDDAWESWLIDAVKYAERDRRRESDQKLARDRRYADHTPKYEKPTGDQAGKFQAELAKRLAEDAKKGAA